MPQSSNLQWFHVGLDCYQVRDGNNIIGFIDVVGAVFVVLIGQRYDRAVEATQTLMLEDALSSLVRLAVPTSLSPKARTA